uniref:Uncharacterized protein n=1 Tax=Arion vulgaris TaxID=1028688 RepID=A0A0B7AR16_9EUPU
MKRLLSEMKIIAPRTAFGSSLKSEATIMTTKNMRIQLKMPLRVVLAFMLLATIDLGGDTHDGIHLRKELARFRIP